MSMNRRILLKSALFSLAIAIGIIFWQWFLFGTRIELLIPEEAELAVWPEPTFSSLENEKSITTLFAQTQVLETKAIKITAPAIIKQGSKIEVGVKIDLPKVESISILVEKNESPLVAHYTFPQQSTFFISTHIKIEKTSEVIVVVRSLGKLYSAKHKISVENNR